MKDVDILYNTALEVRVWHSNWARNENCFQFISSHSWTMFTQIRNFLKPNNDKKQEEKSSEMSSGNNDNNKRNIIVADPNKLSTELAAARFLEQERLRKRTIPTYPGLERYEALEKLGE